MQQMKPEQMELVEGGYERGTYCGLAVALTIGAGILAGGIGVAVTINKALAICAMEYLD